MIMHKLPVMELRIAKRDHQYPKIKEIRATLLALVGYLAGHFLLVSPLILCLFENAPY